MHCWKKRLRRINIAHGNSTMKTSRPDIKMANGMTLDLYIALRNLRIFGVVLFGISLFFLLSSILILILYSEAFLAVFGIICFSLGIYTSISIMLNRAAFTGKGALWSLIAGCVICASFFALLTYGFFVMQYDVTCTMVAGSLCILYLSLASYGYEYLKRVQVLVKHDIIDAGLILSRNCVIDPKAIKVEEGDDQSMTDLEIIQELYDFHGKEGDQSVKDSDIDSSYSRTEYDVDQSVIDSDTHRSLQGNRPEIDGVDFHDNCSKKGLEDNHSMTNSDFHSSSSRSEHDADRSVIGLDIHRSLRGDRSTTDDADTHSDFSSRNEVEDDQSVTDSNTHSSSSTSELEIIQDREIC